MINCNLCIHGVFQKVQDRDFGLRDVISCDLLLKEIIWLMECSRYQEMKKEVVPVIIPDLKFKSIMPVEESVIFSPPKKKGWPKGKKRKV